MALTQLQKKQLELLENNPEEFLNSLQNKKISLSGFKNEFFQNGKGIYHILFDSIFNEKKPEIIEKYLHIFSIIIESDISVLQYHGRKTSAVRDILENIKKTFKDDQIELSNVILKHIFSKETEKNKDPDNKNNYYSHSTINDIFHALLEHTKDYDFLIEKTKEAKNIENDGLFIKKLLKSSIENNDLLNFQKIIKNLNLRENPNFLNELTYGLKDEKYNLLAFSIKCGAYEISQHIIEQLPEISITGYLANKDKYSQQNRITTSEIALRHLSTENPNNEKLVKIMKTIMGQSDMYNILMSHYKQKYPDPNYMGSSHATRLNQPKQTLKYLLQIPELKEYVIENITNIFSSQNETHDKKIALLNTILTTKNIEEIKNILIKIEHEIPKYLNSGNYTYFNINSSFSNLFSGKENKILNTQEEDTYIRIFDILKNRGYVSTNIIFNDIFLLNKNIAKHLIERTPFNTEKDNIYHYLIKEVYKNSKYESNVLETFKVIKDNNPDYLQDICGNNKALIEFFMIDQKMNPSFLSLFDKKDLAKSIKKHNFSDILFSSSFYTFKTEEDTQRFDSLVKNFLDLNFKFFTTENNNTHLYYLCDTLTDKTIIDDICKKEELSFHDIFNDIKFWKNVRFEDTIQYVDSKVKRENIKIQENIPFHLIHSAYLISIEYLIKNNNYKIIQNENEDTILHLAVKHDQYLVAQKAVELIPDMAMIKNKQNKTALSYLFVDFDKECQNLEKNKSVVSYRHQSTIVKDTFYKILDQGITKNSKAKKILEKQLEKYPRITNTYPELKQLFMVKTLEVALEDKAVLIKRAKI